MNMWITWLTIWHMLQIVPACQCRRPKRSRFDPWVGKIRWRRSWQPTPVFLPGEDHGQRSLGSQRVRHNWSNLAHRHANSRDNMSFRSSVKIDQWGFRLVALWVRFSSCVTCESSDITGTMKQKHDGSRTGEEKSGMYWSWDSLGKDR